MKKESHTVSFRLDPHYLGKLEGEASKHSVSVHEQARRMVIDDLDRRDGEAILERLTEIRTEVQKVSEVEKSVADLRADLAEAVDWIVKKLQKG
jgi:hypothetical protein